jgi:hypothetical protein
MAKPAESWYFSLPWQTQASTARKHVWAIRDEVAKREPRFSNQEGEFDFRFLGRIGGESFNRIRATPDLEKREVRVLLQYDHEDSAFVSPVKETAFAFPIHKLTGNPERDATLFAAGLQNSIQKLYLEHEDMRDGFEPKWQIAFAPALGTETPLLSFMDRAEEVQKAHTAIVTKRIIALSDHLRDDVPSVPRSLPAVVSTGPDLAAGRRH